MTAYWESVLKILTWNPTFTDKQTADLAYWERNVLALHFADPSKGDGWYNDDIETPIESGHSPVPGIALMGNNWSALKPRYKDWRRVISLQNGSITFHLPDDFDVGDLPQIERNWDGHTTHEKWARILAARGVEITA